ncbi:MAG: tRNA (adenosine(37)-N6)-threonylcarbamoyltransferase complex ATPase subunit type 1 TsaE [Pseudomonadota bacterium]|nr:tRNA (adenosine(37)-N6)-threonylcarbamoyltransferase complex ATPase subunit type 1 TsaE [Pseudomonadota bacterium]
MADLTFTLADETATASLGEKLAPLLRTGDVVGLSGPLGAGKTTLARGLIAALTGAVEAPSPTFTLVEAYETKAFVLWHFDLYRLERPEDVWELGLEEALASGVALIEWPERIAAILPPESLVVRLNPSGSGRAARVRGGGDWPARLAASAFVNPRIA